MKEYVDIEGSGENTTKLVGCIDVNSDPGNLALVIGVPNTELRLLTSENTCGEYGSTVAIRVEGTTISNVTAISTGSWAGGIRSTDAVNPSKIRNTKIIVTAPWYASGILDPGASVISNTTISLTGSGNKYGIAGGGNGTRINNVTVTSGNTGNITVNRHQFSRHSLFS
jgi:hypothetical protein